MLLREYNKLLEIDELITGLQEQLTSLYASRAAIILPGEPAQKKKTSKISDTLEGDVKSFVTVGEYQRLLQAWSRYEIEIPAFNQLEKQITKALDVRTFINKTVPVLQDRLKLVLCPPAKILNQKALTELQDQHPNITNDDTVQQSLLKSFRAKKWHLLLVYGEKEGLYMGTPETVMDHGTELLHGHDSLALGAPEYLALSLQEKNTLDVDTHTLLPKHGLHEGTIPAVTCKNGSYEFLEEDADTLFGDVRHRPAINIL